ncbi:XRE family transcriptional regulator [Actinoplanes subglobosus]|uniref:XRE family transcriptional regulator n=1 Tax=Actinoplanes subglobosus TaxID=1547892 RepID=A0ABV8IYB5_9ACTN
MNERLRTTMLRRGVTTDQLAVECGVDVKSVERWISLNRVPHRNHRWTAAKLLEADETFLWPSVLTRSAGRRAREASQAELVELYPDRATVPRETWLGLLTNAQQAIDVLVHSGTFFAQTQPRVATMLAERASKNVRVRLCFGNPQAEAVAIRDREERLGGTLAAKIRASLTYYRSLIDVEGCEIRLHDAALYTSMFRYDDDLLANAHVYGAPASLNPTFHFRRIDGGTVFDHYMEGFEKTWESALPWLGAEI